MNLELDVLVRNTLSDSLCVHLSEDASLELLEYTTECVSDLNDSAVLSEFQSLTTEFKSTYMAYENALAICDHIQKYGVSQELLDITGYSEEGLLSSISSILSRFLTWLFDAIRKICTFIKEKILGAAGSTFKKLKELKTKSQQGVLNSIDIPENHEKLRTFTDTLPDNLIQWTFTSMQKDSLKDMEDTLDEFKNITWISSSRDIAKSFANSLMERVYKQYTKVADTATRLSSISKPKLSDNMTEEEFNKELKRIGQALGTNKIRWHYQEEESVQTKIKAFREKIIMVQKAFSLFYRMFILAKQIGLRIYTQLCASSETSSRAGVFIRVSPPASIIKKLREIWKFPEFKIKSVIVTNMSDDMISKNKGLGGFVNRVDPDKYKAYVVYVNCSHFRDADTFTDAFKSAKAHYNEFKSDSPHMYEPEDNEADFFISTMIHEMRHCLQYQTNDPGLQEKVPPSFIQTRESHVQYLKKHVEQEARRAANEYVKNHITEEDRKWARAIIARTVKQEHTNEKKFRPDAQ